MIAVDEPALGMTIGINTLAAGRPVGHAADRAHGRAIASQQELVGNVAIRVLETERPDTWEVQGRGELQLAVLVETMRREGFELTVGKPQVVTREVDGAVHEPIERLAIDVPEDFLGVVTQMLALRKGRLENMVNHGTGWVRLDFLVPTRGLIGFRTEFLTETRGTGILHSVFERYEPWQGEIRTRPTGSLVADRRGPTATFALLKLQERGQLFVGPGEEVYEGMVVGENARADDLDVNAVREKKLTNMRAAGSDETVKLVPAHRLSLDQALEFIRDDECVEVTPDAVRLRKLTLDPTARMKESRARKRVPRRQAFDRMRIVRAGIERIDDLQPLWESLHEHHATSRRTSSSSGRCAPPISRGRCGVSCTRNGSPSPTRSSCWRRSTGSRSATRSSTCAARRRPGRRASGSACWRRSRSSPTSADAASAARCSSASTPSCGELGVTELQVAVISKNAAALRFYERHGLLPFTVSFMGRVED